MPRVINIEIMRLKPTKKTAIVMAFLALVIGCLITALPGTEAQYAQADQDRHVFYFDKNNDVEVSLSEEQWSFKYGEEGLNYTTGATAEKDPVFKNEKGDCYMRACVRITDKFGNPLNPSRDNEKMKNILNTLWYDPDAGTENEHISLEEGKELAKYDLRVLKEEGTCDQICNRTAFEEPVYNEEMQAYTMNMKELFKSGESVSLFNRVVIPYDLDELEVQHMGDYYVVVWAQAIQSKGFSDANTALSYLSNDYVKTEIDWQKWE